jgi:hypothetical protein
MCRKRHFRATAKGGLLQAWCVTYAERDVQHLYIYRARLRTDRRRKPDQWKQNDQCIKFPVWSQTEFQRPTRQTRLELAYVLAVDSLEEPDQPKFRKDR